LRVITDQERAFNPDRLKKCLNFYKKKGTTYVLERDTAFAVLQNQALRRQQVCKIVLNILIN